MKGKVFWGIVLLIILSIFIFYLNCTKNSTKYEFRIGHYLYVSNTGGSVENKIYIISTETDLVVDSISLGPYKWPSNLALSPDKRILYVTVTLFDTLTHSGVLTHYEIDTRTKTIKYNGPNSSTKISPDGVYLFTPIPQEGQYRIFNAYSHQIVYQESTIFYPVCFDKKAPLVYGRGEKPNEIRCFNYEAKRWIQTIYIRLRDGSIPGLNDYLLSPDGNTLYLLARQYDYYFCVYDLTQDSLLIQLIINSIGQLGIKPDGNTIYVTDPGGGGACVKIEPPPTGNLGVFDAQTNTTLPSISLDPLSDSLTGHPLGPFYIRINPDGRKAYLTICFDRVLVIDLIMNEPLKAIIFPEHSNFTLTHIAL